MNIKLGHRGVAIIMAMITLAVISIIAAAYLVGVSREHRMTYKSFRALQAINLAEAGVESAIWELNYGGADFLESEGWSGTNPTKTVVSFSISGGEIIGDFTVTVTNPGGDSPIIEATGYAPKESSAQAQRTVRVAMEKGSWWGFDYAFTSGNTGSFAAAGYIEGNIRCNGDIVFQSATTVVPIYGEGKVLGNTNIQPDAKLTVQDEVRARGEVKNQSSIEGETLISDKNSTPAENTSATDALEANGSVEYAANRIPNPKTSEINGAITDTITGTTYNTELDIDGKVVSFPNGITFQSGSSITGTGTIVVPNGQSVVFEVSLGTVSPVKMNLIVWSGGDGTVGGGTVTFNRSTHIDGLIFCHDDINVVSSLDVRGAVISYKPGGGDINLGSQADIRYNTSILGDNKPLGFDSWMGDAPPGGADTAYSVVSWQELL